MAGLAVEQLRIGEQHILVPRVQRPGACIVGKRILLAPCRLEQSGARQKAVHRHAVKVHGPRGGGDGLFPLAKLPQAFGHAPVRLGMARVCRDGLLQDLPRFSWPLQFEEHGGGIHIGFAIAGLERIGARVARQGLFLAAEKRQAVGEIVVCLGKARPQPQGCLIARHRLLGEAAVPLRQPPVQQEFRRVRHEPRGRLEAGKCCLMAAELHHNEAAVLVRLDLARVDARGSREAFGRALEQACLVERHRPHVGGVIVSRVELQNALIGPGCRLEVAPLVAGARLVHEKHVAGHSTRVSGFGSGAGT